MPFKKLKPCKAYGCAELTTDKYCTKHKHLEEQDQHLTYNYYNKTRNDKEYTDFYKTKEWKKVSNLVTLRDLGLCQQCKREGRTTIADMVHHIKPLKKAFHLRLVQSNLESLCFNCHNKIDHTKL